MLSPPGFWGRLCQQLVGDFTLEVGESEVTSLVSVGQLGVIKTEAVEEGGVEVVDVNFIADNLQTEWIRFTHHLTGLDAPASQPEAEGIGVMVSTSGGLIFMTSLHHGCAAELSTPDHQRLC